MREVNRGAIVPYSPERMFALVADVASYPRFLPGCIGSRVLSQDDAEMVASLDLARGPLKAAFTTRNALEPPRRMTMALLEGPFDVLQGEWLLTPLGEHGCRVELRVRFAFTGRARDLLLGPLLELTLNGVVDAFVAEARRLYG